MLFSSPQKWLLIAASLMGFVSVAAGAFGSHALKERLDPQMLNAFEVGARYQMYHALALFAAVWIASVIPGVFANLSGWLFLIGTLIFSGSLYLLALTQTRWLGAITPIGGLLLLLGWLSLALAFFKKV